MKVDMRDYLELMAHLMRDMRDQLNEASVCVYELKEDECRKELLDEERYSLLLAVSTGLSRLSRTVHILGDLAVYSCTDRLERRDRFPVNEQCRELAAELDLPVEFHSDLSDDYAIMTNQECLWRVLGILLEQAEERVYNRRENSLEPRISLTVTNRCEKGKLRFVVTDTGDAEPEEEISAFDLPREYDGQDVFEMVKLYVVSLAVRLLGGFVYKDSRYTDGRRVVFDIGIC